MKEKLQNFQVYNSIARLVLCVMAGLFMSCSHPPNITPEGPYWKDADRKPIPEPEYAEPGLLWLSVDRQLFDQGLELADLDRNMRKITGNPRQAENINSFDEVPNSSWFTNRHGHPSTRMTTGEITQGCTLTSGPDTTGGWTVFRPKIGGVTPGFWIEDTHGNEYIIKFDPIGYPEMSTGATVMAGRFFNACGYNVAQETIVYWRPDNLRIREGVTVKGEDGIKRPFTMDDLNDILNSIQREPDGSIRSLASLNLGNVKGPFMYSGTRDDDPNDWCPHQHRRELRGLYVMASFVNHFDIKDHNSMDVYVGEDGQGYLDHYLMDFGSTFGSAGHSPQKIINGYTNWADVLDMGVSIATLGLKKWQWEDAKAWTNPTVGYYESEIFHPAKWDPIYPIPAFENMTDRDGYWGAKIVMSFRDDDLRAIIAAGQYTDPEVEDYLLKTMKERRDKIGRYWFGKVNPLDHFQVISDSQGVTIDFEDLPYFYGLESPANESGGEYKYRISHRGRTIIEERTFVGSKIILNADDMELIYGAYASTGERTQDKNPRFEVEIRSRRDGGRWTKPVRLTLWHHPEKYEMKLVAIEHAD